MKKTWINSICWIGFVLIAIFVLAPLLWGLRTSFTPNTRTFVDPQTFYNGTLPQHLCTSALSVISQKYPARSLRGDCGHITYQHDGRLCPGAVSISGEKFELCLNDSAAAAANCHSCAAGILHQSHRNLRHLVCSHDGHSRL